MESEVDVVDAFTILVAVDQVERCATDAPDGGQAQFHWPGGNFDRLRSLLERHFVGLVGIGYAERHAAGAGAVLLREIGGVAFWLVVDDEIDSALAVQDDVFRAVAGHLGEAERLEYGFKHAGFG